ncbi:hypothetical protein KIN20_025981 [Parelaphostrongylus tenuis]|uniref:Uncharacterized protein n=1 Tax=Parelaphostrongylus tenuis TaxID=148309 RepID=A0AAD5N9W3_PARTN|nr:hypothetical protein KIN20_025981 [Parelaphostrongylus tenuis]
MPASRLVRKQVGSQTCRRCLPVTAVQATARCHLKPRTPKLAELPCVAACTSDHEPSKCPSSQVMFKRPINEPCSC